MDIQTGMESFTDEHSNILVTKEWLVKVDPSLSIPYLIKYGNNADDSQQFIFVTDMKTVWAEVLTEKHVLRRWRDCNPSLPITASDNVFSQLCKLLSSAHTSGGITDANFEIVDSKDADLAFNLDFDDFKWRWDTYLLGPKTSAEILSRHLIIPLISLSHITFNSADSLSELDEADLEKTVDKVCRSARRSIDTHVKQTIARPRLTTTLQRISALFGLSPELPSIVSEPNQTDLNTDFLILKSSLRASIPHEQEYALQVVSETNPSPQHHPEEPEKDIKSVEKADDKSKEEIAAESSVTESDEEELDEDDGFSLLPPTENLNGQPSLEDNISSKQRSNSPVSGPSIINSDPDTSPPQKRAKTKVMTTSTDSDSDSEEQGKNTHIPSGNSRGGKTSGRGVRQPIKRGVRRF